MTDDKSIFSRLMAVIEERRASRPAGSYTSQLLDGGIEAIGAKVLEEAAELVEAAGTPDDRGGVVHEAADLIYHAFVLMAFCGVTLAEVEDELTRRFGVSGLAGEG
jgi:phosphoribosyl-ATP pyrophosphohydrolase